MKKTLITLLALCGVASAADELTPVWSMEDIDVSGNTNYPITLTDATISSETGYTAVITLNWTEVANAPLFWLGTDDGSNYKNSTATFGYKGDSYHASLFNNTNGSNSGATDNATGITTTLQDYSLSDEDTVITDKKKSTSLKNKTLTYFLTSNNGTSALYGLTNNNEVVQIATQTGMTVGNVTALHVGHWGTNSNYSDGIMSIALYNGVMEKNTMQSIAGAVIPEPTTATLSLLALAGLAARRRRSSR